MPKVFSEDERKFIDKRLREEAAYCLTNFGVKRTTVDELVKRVQIPKGTFYLFYDSKEELLFRALLDLHEQIEKELVKRIDDLTDIRNVELVTDALLDLFKLADQSGLLRMMTTGELDLIYRKLPNEVFQAHLADDFDAVEAIFILLEVPLEKIDGYAAAFRGLFVTMLYKREVGEAHAFEALRLCIRGLVIQMFE
ncbi:TetR family transcriptional regulator [Candidatus Enterococcus ferrettii]|uniref:HTH tetR-type domain-containing protein n=1 Tax=Candidatus Enterococcus ferrettii TaxID=2815324 RepID=A0ABV0EVH3_9ENTE|nr:TetR/AcrR family transcriptional regulator [Enterococcus sp. 665A]